jgi:ribonuclease J
MKGTIKSIKIIPLGGLGEFGMNMMAIGWEDEYIIIDCGKMFPEDKHFGIEAVIPDFTFVRENSDKILGLFITHGHEDHIGAVPHLLKELDIPVYATPLTIGLTRQRLREVKLHDSADLNDVEKGEIVEVGKFMVEFISVSHGIPDSCSLAVTTPGGVVIHTGDFKIDQTPLDDQIFDYHTFARYGQEGVMLLMSDSTNIERPGYTYSERDVYDGFLKIFTEARGKILIASFASHFHRMQQIIDIAAEFSRKIAFCGRSMEQNSRLAKELGYLEIPYDMEISHKHVGKYPANKVVVIASGSQAEPNSALAKIATDNHPYVKLKPGDTVALSARKIPGNEKAIAGIINHLYRRGANVISDKTLDIHVSGHGCKEELKTMINLVNPRYFMPIHGEFRQLYLHAEEAYNMGYSDEAVVIAESGDIVEVNDLEIAIDGKVHVGHVLVDKSESEAMDRDVVGDRKVLAQEGVICPIIALDLNNGPKVKNIHFLTKALSSLEEANKLLESAEEMIINIVEECSVEECRDEDLIKAKVGKAIRKYMLKAYNIRPMILPVIMEIS